MQGIDANRIIRIAVLPCVRHIRVVDGQYLKNTLVGLVGPLNHQFQIAEVTHTKRTLAAQRENGNHRTGTLPWIDGKAGL